MKKLALVLSLFVAAALGFGIAWNLYSPRADSWEGSVWKLIPEKGQGLFESRYPKAPKPVITIVFLAEGHALITLWPTFPASNRDGNPRFDSDEPVVSVSKMKWAQRDPESVWLQWEEHPTAPIVVAYRKQGDRDQIVLKNFVPNPMTFERVKF